MGIFNRLKRLMAPQEQTQEERKNIYEELGLVQPFTVLAGGQLNAFISELSENKRWRKIIWRTAYFVNGKMKKKK